MKGFFTKKQTESTTRPDGRVHSCSACGLYRDVASPRMKPFGNFKKGILNIGEAPGDVEDEQGKPWQGKTGNLLKSTYRQLGIDLFEDCLNMNAINCHPTDKNGNNRTPTPDEIAHCRRMVLNVIKEHKPKVIVLFGNAAVESIIGHRWQRELGGIMKWRGWTIPDRDFSAWICPVFHPSYVSRTEGQEVETIWIQDLKNAIQYLDTPLPEYREPDIKIITDLTKLNKIRSTYVAIDYETTGIKPHSPGHRIICVSVATHPDHCYSFIMPTTKLGRQPFVDLLRNPDIGKMAHNIKYEETWSVVRLRQPVKNWRWDSMLASHVLDNRSGITSLKFQVYVQFGVVDYESEVSTYLESGSKDGNALNRIDELLKHSGGQEQLLKYNGLDAVYEFRLAEKQMSEIIEDNLPF